MDKPVQIQTSTGSIRMVILLFVVACAMALGIMKLMVPTTVAQIAGNQELLAAINQAFEPMQETLTTLEARVEALERRGTATDAD